MIKNMVWRATHDRTGKMLNPLIHIFFYVTFVYGLFFTFFAGTESVQESPLYQHARDAFGSLPLPIWGGCAMLVTVINTVAIVSRRRRWLGCGGMLGFGIWLFASFIYLQDGLWFQLCAGAVPNLLFWIWYYFRVKWYYTD